MSDKYMDFDEAGEGQQDNYRVKFDDIDDFDAQEQPSSRIPGLGRLSGMVRDFNNRLNVGIRRSTSEMVPENTRQHFRNAQREFLLAWRALIDQQLERLETPEKAETTTDNQATSRPKPVKIEVVED